MSDSKQAFFVGYAKMPKALKRFYTVIAFLVIGLAVITSLAIANAQKSAGTGVWQTEQTVTVTGLLTVAPYPVLQVTTDAGIESHLVVMTGKFGADVIAEPHHNRHVSVTGYAISRGGWNMLELSGPDDIVLADTDAAAVTVPTQSLGSTTLSGEIIDSKCFLGVMKPGAGPVHRACAELCLLGGIPPMLVVQDPGTGDRYGYMVIQSDGSSAATSLASRAGTQATFSGELIQHGDLLYLKLDNSQLAALDS